MAKLGDMAVGSTVKIKVNDTLRDFLIVQQGNPDTSIYDASCDGTWVLMKYTHGNELSWHSSNTNDYANSTIHAYLNSTFFSVVDTDIRNVVKQVKIPYQNGIGYGGSLMTGSNGLSTKVFLLSGYEVGFITGSNGYLPKEGVRLAYFSNDDSNDVQSKRIAYKDTDNSATTWWLRSPTFEKSDVAQYVSSSGYLGQMVSSNLAYDRPAFILPSGLEVSDDASVMPDTPPTITTDATDLGEQNAPFAVGYTVTDDDGDLMTVTEKLDGEVKATKTSTPPTVVQVQTARNDEGAAPAWDTYPAKYEFFMPLTAKKAGLLLRSLEFRVKGYVPGTMRTVLRKYGSETALVDKFIDIIRGYNDVVLDMGNIALEKGVEYQLYFAASNNFYPPSVQPSLVVENDYVDIATGSAYYGDDTTLIFSGTVVLVDNHLTESGASTADLTVDWLSEKAEYQQVLNGSHTVTLEVTDGILTSTKDITFTKNVTGAEVSLTAPLTADDAITVASLTLEGTLPEDMSLTVEMTNNGLDVAPVWEQCTKVQVGKTRVLVNHVFANTVAAKGAAFNYRVTIARGESGTGGTLTMIGGVIG